MKTNGSQRGASYNLFNYIWVWPAVMSTIWISELLHSFIWVMSDG